MGCASGRARSAESAVQVAAQADELSELRTALAAREKQLHQLENRLALLEAEQRQLRYAVAEREPVQGVRETVRIGASRRSQDLGSERDAGAEEPRPVLRLMGERRREREPAPLMPIPIVSEKLPIAPLPENVEVPPGEVSDPAEHYRRAIDMVSRRELDLALTSLTDFLVRHPSHTLSPKVMFWRGEVLFAKRDYGRALDAFESAVAREPRGDKAADSLLKISMCHERLGAKDRARATLERLKAQFPESDAARLAAQEDA